MRTFSRSVKVTKNQNFRSEVWKERGPTTPPTVRTVGVGDVPSDDEMISVELPSLVERKVPILYVLQKIVRREFLRVGHPGQHHELDESDGEEIRTLRRRVNT